MHYDLYHKILLLFDNFCHIMDNGSLKERAANNYPDFQDLLMVAMNTGFFSASSTK